MIFIYFTNVTNRMETYMSLETLRQTGSTHEHVDNKRHRHRQGERGREGGCVPMYCIH